MTDEPTKIPTVDAMLMLFGDWRDKSPTLDANDAQERFMRFASGDDSAIPDGTPEDAAKLLRGMRAQWQVSNAYRERFEAVLRVAVRMIIDRAHHGGPIGEAVSTEAERAGVAYRAGQLNAFTQAAQLLQDVINEAWQTAQAGWTR